MLLLLDKYSIYSVSRIVKAASSGWRPDDYYRVCYTYEADPGGGVKSRLQFSRFVIIKWPNSEPTRKKRAVAC
jgi:hypothetical protein